VALIPRMYRPAVVIRRKALHSGVFGPSRFWKFVAVLVFGRNILKKVFGRNPELIGKATLKGPGHLMQIETIAPDSRRARRR
jgi:hypothetical protein